MLSRFLHVTAIPSSSVLPEFRSVCSAGSCAIEFGVTQSTQVIQGYLGQTRALITLVHNDQLLNVNGTAL